MPASYQLTVDNYDHYGFSARFRKAFLVRKILDLFEGFVAEHKLDEEADEVTATAAVTLGPVEVSKTTTKRGRKPADEEATVPAQLLPETQRAPASIPTPQPVSVPASVSTSAPVPAPVLATSAAVPLAPPVIEPVPHRNHVIDVAKAVMSKQSAVLSNALLQHGCSKVTLVPDEKLPAFAKTLFLAAKEIGIDPNSFR